MSSGLSVLLVGINYAPETTGIAPYSAGFGGELVRRGNRVRAVTAHPHYPQWSFGGDVPRRSKEWSNGVRVERFRHRLPARPGGVSRALSELSFGLASTAARIGRPDVAVLVSPALLSTAVTLLRLHLFHRSVPVVVWVQDLYSLGLRELGSGEPGRAVRAIAAVERWVLRTADRVVVIHERFRDTVVDEMGVERHRVEVVRNWSHTEPGIMSDRSAVRAGRGWGPDDFVVLHAGNMGLKQGLENVVEAAKVAGQRGSTVRFILLGDGNQRDDLAKRAADVRSIEMIGSLPDDEFRAVLDAADALLVNERPGVAGMAVPSKLTTYFSTGRPVIAATDPGSITESEVLLAGAGPVVPAGDPAALLAAAEALSADPVGAAEMGASGLDFRASHLSPERSFDTFTRLLDDLAQGRKPSDTRGAGHA